jgi:hypothetical protein
MMLGMDSILRDTQASIDANRVAIEALERIALLQDTAPLAAEFAVEGLRAMKELLVRERPWAAPAASAAWVARDESVGMALGICSEPITPARKGGQYYR